MAKAVEIRFCVRGKAGPSRYKLVGGAWRTYAEARGEDSFISKFEAISTAASTAHTWRMRPQGFVIDVHEVTA